METLEFLKQLKQRVSDECNFWQCEKDKIPSSPGVYLLIAKRVRFRYPAGWSSVYYIGQAKSLHARIVKTHRKWHDHVKGDRRQDNVFYEPRHEYGGVFG